MGTTKVQSGSQTNVTPTPQEQEMENMQLQNMRQTYPQMSNLQNAGMALTQSLLQGNQNLPGYLGTMAQGISPDVTQSMVNLSLRDIYPQFQAQGILDSGTAATGAMRTAADIRNQAAQFNIGSYQNLLNLALGGQAQVQSPILSNAGMLGGNLAGLRSISNQGYQNTTASGLDQFSNILGSVGKLAGGLGSMGMKIK